MKNLWNFMGDKRLQLVSSGVMIACASVNLTRGHTILAGLCAFLAVYMLCNSWAYLEQIK